MGLLSGDLSVFQASYRYDEDSVIAFVGKSCRCYDH